MASSSGDVFGAIAPDAVVTFDHGSLYRVTSTTLPAMNGRTFGDVYANDAGHVELQYTARASYACNKAFGAPVGKAFGLCVGAPAGIGVLMVDAAVKSADVEMIGYLGPTTGLSYTNEVVGLFSGDAGAVRQAILTAREVGCRLLGSLGTTPACLGVPYI